MATTIVTKKGSGAPAASDLVEGELAVDTTNGRLYTENSSAAVVELGSNPSGNITFGDNGKAIFGAGSDLQIYHDGNHSYIEDAGTGSIKIKVGDFRVENASGNNLIKGVGDVATLHHAGSEKLATASTGIDVTGTVTADGLTVSNSSLQVKLEEADGTNNPRLVTYFDSSGTHLQHTWSSAASNLIFEVGGSEGSGTERMRIDSSGSVGIGVVPQTDWNSAYRALQVGETATFMGAASGAGEGNWISNNAIFSSSGNWEYINTASASSVDMQSSTAPFRFRYAASGTAGTAITWSEAARFDSSGNLLVGGTSTNPTGQNVSGAAIDASGEGNFSVDGAEALRLNRKTSDGDIAKFMKDGATVGSVFNSGTTLGVGSLDTGVLFANNIDAILPWNASTNAERDNAIDLGRSAGRFKDLYLSGVVRLGTSTTYGTIEGKANDLEIIANAGQVNVSPNIIFKLANAGGAVDERARIDNSGNLLVGTTNTAVYTSSSESGLVYRADFGLIGVSRQDNYSGSFNRYGTDGDIVNFRKDGTTVGSIGAINDSLYIASPYSTDSGLRFSASIVHPCTTTGAPRDNAIDLGYASGRFDDIYATNGTIQTSDRNEKQDIEALSDAEQRVAVAAKGLLRKFRWKSSVAEKGDDARTHFGIIAQDLQAAFEAEGLDAGDYAMFINSTWTDEETGEERSRMGVRYSELLAFIIAAI